MPKGDRWSRRNNRIRAENDFNKVLKEYVCYKYGPIADEFVTFYDMLSSKYPSGKTYYKGSKEFRSWVSKQISEYVDADNQTPSDELTQLVNETIQPRACDELTQVVNETIQPRACEQQQQQQQQLDHGLQEHLEQVQREQELDELDNLVAGIIADLEAGQDEGIDMDDELRCDSEIDFDIDVEERTEAELDDLVAWF